MERRRTKNGTREGKETARQQFTEQMDQLCRPNYREKEVGALGEGHKQRQTARTEREQIKMEEWR